MLSGVANAIIPGSLLDTPVSYEGLRAIGSGLGSAGFMVFDDTVDMTSVAAGVANFLAVESCGQCLPCKLDGLAVSDLLAKLGRSNLAKVEYDTLSRRLANVADRARCYLAIQQQVVLESILEHFGAELTGHLRHRNTRARLRRDDGMAERRKVCVVVASRANLARILIVLEAVRAHPGLQLQVWPLAGGGPPIASRSHDRGERPDGQETGRGDPSSTATASVTGFVLHPQLDGGGPHGVER